MHLNERIYFFQTDDYLRLSYGVFTQNAFEALGSYVQLMEKRVRLEAGWH